MERMRVSAMKIVRNGQMPVREAAERYQQPGWRDAVYARMRDAARKHRKKACGERGVAQGMRQEGLTGRGGERLPAWDVRRANGERSDGVTLRRGFLAQAAICAAALVCVAVMRMVDTPLTQQVTNGLSEAVTMEVDIGKEIGRLQFVRSIVPDAVLTFWESTSESLPQFVMPFEGAVAAEFNEDRPGIAYVGADGTVRSAADGVVESVRETENSGFAIRIRHAGGISTQYGMLQGVKVAPGDEVKTGQDIALGLEGKAGYHLYFQMLRAGEAVDPSERIGLQ